MENFRPIGGRMGRPGDVANAAEYFASNLAGWVSGQHLLVSGGAPAIDTSRVSITSNPTRSPAINARLANQVDPKIA